MDLKADNNILSALPGYAGKEVLITTRQSVYDIIREILAAHKEFCGQYDGIALYFDDSSTKKICDKLYKFCKENVKYKQEPEKRQTTKSPAAILSQGYGDCKHYASFIGGVLDALNRRGRKIDWHYRFASYSFFDHEPEHIFVVAKINGKEHWIDPTPGAESAVPVWVTNRKVKQTKSMALYRISGIDEMQFIETDYSPATPLDNAIMLLMDYGLINDRAQIDFKKVKDIQLSVDPNNYQKILDAVQIAAQGAAVSGFFSDLWKGVKKVTLAIPRNAFLSLVAINAFNYGKKLYNSLYKKDGGYTDFKDKLKLTWEKLGGNFSNLERAIKSGARKAGVLKGFNGIGAAQIPAWVAVAGAIVTAIMPLVNAFLNRQKAAELPITDYLPYEGTYQDPANTGTNNFLSGNTPLIIAGIAAVYLLTNKKK